MSSRGARWQDSEKYLNHIDPTPFYEHALPNFDSNIFQHTIFITKTSQSGNELQFPYRASGPAEPVWIKKMYLGMILTVNVSKTLYSFRNSGIAAQAWKKHNIPDWKQLWTFPMFVEVWKKRKNPDLPRISTYWATCKDSKTYDRTRGNMTGLAAIHQGSGLDVKLRGKMTGLGKIFESYWSYPILRACTSELWFQHLPTYHLHHKNIPVWKRRLISL